MRCPRATASPARSSPARARWSPTAATGASAAPPGCAMPRTRACRCSASATATSCWRMRSAARSATTRPAARWARSTSNCTRTPTTIRCSPACRRSSPRRPRTCRPCCARPQGATVLARSAQDDCHAFRWGERAWGVQFHPEFSATHMRGYVHARHDALHARGPLRQVAGARASAPRRTRAACCGASCAMRAACTGTDLHGLRIRRFAFRVRHAPLASFPIESLPS